MKDENYIVIQGWMINRLNLSGNELVVFAVIYGFSQDGTSSFQGSVSYLVSCTGSSKNTVIRSLKSLVEKGFILKEEIMIQNVTLNRYKANCTPIPKMGTDPIPKMGQGGGAKMGTNNTNIVDNTNKIIWENLLLLLNKKTGRNFQVINDTVKRKFRARLREGYTKENIITAIETATKLEHHRNSDFKYLTPEFFSRASTLDKYGVSTKPQEEHDNAVKSKINVNKITAGDE